MYFSTSKTNSWRAVSSMFRLIIMIAAASVVAGDSLETDREILLSLQAFLQEKNPVNQGKYSLWNQNSTNPCDWPGISCLNAARVTGLDLSGSEITGDIYQNFSSLTALSHLDFSRNTITGGVSEDLSQCSSLKYLNLSHNIIEGQLNLTKLNQLEVLDLSVNRFSGDLERSFPEICSGLVVANVSANTLGHKRPFTTVKNCCLCMRNTVIKTPVNLDGHNR